MNVNVSIDAVDNPVGGSTYIMMAQDYDGKRRFTSVSAVVGEDGRDALVKVRKGVLSGRGLVHPDVSSKLKTIKDTRDEPLSSAIMCEMARALGYVLDVPYDGFEFARLFGYTPLSSTEDDSDE